VELTHSFTVPTSVEDAWALFMDLERVGGCFPGATVTDTTHDTFSGTVKVKLGPIALVYSGSGSIVQRDDLVHHAVIEAKGKDKRGNGTAGATVTITLRPDLDGTRADVVTDLAVTGKPAQFGRGVMQDVSDKLLQAFVACIEKQLGGAGTEQADATGAPVTAEASASSGASEASEASGASGASGASEASRASQPSGASQTSEPAAGVTSADAAPEASTARAGGQDALDLGTAVLPVLVQRYAPYAGAALVGALVGWLIGRRGD
jgi:carbon monoxide dehydrogenase subunit G